MAVVTNLRTVRKKIRSIENLKKITRAMQMVAAARLRKAQEKLMALRDYERLLTTITDKVVSCTTESLDKWTIENETEKTCTIIFSSEKGLCGSYNSNLYRFIDKDHGLKNTNWITCGKKIDNHLKKRDRNIINNVQSSKELGEEIIFKLASQLIDDFLSQKYKKIQVVYTNFKNIVNCRPATATLLPMKLAQSSNESITPLFEPKPDLLLDELIPYRIGTTLLLLYYESLVSEHASRMNAMQNATDNTEDLIKELVLVRNKVRQSLITRELLDIVTGAEAMKK
ncbi:MAG: ATP synthase F1 subunit gamma [Planctomycetes bacterium]|nr:ATP synthase F1 subunit gamma [Planctomycetota bacterium]